MNPNTLMLKNSSNGPSSDIARLRGARLVTSVELPEDKWFDENLIKQLTGGDQVTARNLYESEFDFTPTLKLMICGNHKPIAKGTDYGFWRRFKLVPFTATIDKPDPFLTEKLWDERSGILNWCIEGWKIFQSEGFLIPKIVQEESLEYRNEMDVVGKWKSECIINSFGNKVSVKELYQSYRAWAIENGFNNPMTINSFGRKLKPKLGSSTRGAGGVSYNDIAVK